MIRREKKHLFCLTGIWRVGLISWFIRFPSMPIPAMSFKHRIFMLINQVSGFAQIHAQMVLYLEVLSVVIKLERVSIRGLDLGTGSLVDGGPSRNRSQKPISKNNIGILFALPKARKKGLSVIRHQVNKR